MGKRAGVNRIGFIGFGAVASTLAPPLFAHGGKILAYDVLLDDGMEALKRRAGDVPVEFGNRADVLTRSDIVLKR